MILTITCIIAFVCMDIGILYKVQTFDNFKDSKAETGIVLYSPEWIEG